MRYTLADGRLDRARFCASPNHDSRPSDAVIDLLVIHCIALPPRCYGGPYVEQLFTNCLQPDGHPCFAQVCTLEVSAHFFIRRGGELVQFVNCEQRAWHAGVSEFLGRERCNDFSIGIELEGSDDGLFTGAQYQVLAHVTAAIQHAYPLISDERIVGHSDIAPGRKTDPGRGFDWSGFRDTLLTCR